MTTTFQLLARQRNWMLRSLRGFDSWLTSLQRIYNISPTGKVICERIRDDLKLLEKEINFTWRSAKRRNLNV